MTRKPETPSFAVMDDDGATNLCPSCGEELRVEPVATDHHLAMALMCGSHGSVAVLEPF